MPILCVCLLFSLIIINKKNILEVSEQPWFKAYVIDTR